MVNFLCAFKQHEQNKVKYFIALNIWDFPCKTNIYSYFCGSKLLGSARSHDIPVTHLIQMLLSMYHTNTTNLSRLLGVRSMLEAQGHCLKLVKKRKNVSSEGSPGDVPSKELISKKRWFHKEITISPPKKGLSRDQKTSLQIAAAGEHFKPI